MGTNGVKLCSDMFHDAFESLFIDNQLVLDRFEKFLSVVARFGDIRNFTCANLLLIYKQNADAKILKSANEWNENGVYISNDSETIHVLMKNEDDLYEMFNLYDISSTSANSSNLNDEASCAELRKALLSCIVASNITLTWVTAASVQWKEWARLQTNVYNEILIVIRKPSSEEIEQLGLEKIEKFQFKAMIETYCELYFIQCEAEIPDKAKVDESIDALKSFVSDLVCYKYNLFEEHYITVYPKVFEGEKPLIADFRKVLDYCLRCYSSLIISIDEWLYEIQNPTDLTNEEGVV